MNVYRTRLDGCTVLRPECSVSAQLPTDERELWRGMVAWIAHERRYQPGWVSHMYRAKWGEWPLGEPGSSVQQIRPTDDVRAEIEDLIRAYRKAKLAERKQSAGTL